MYARYLQYNLTTQRKLSNYIYFFSKQNTSVVLFTCVSACLSVVRRLFWNQINDSRRVTLCSSVQDVNNVKIFRNAP